MHIDTSSTPWVWTYDHLGLACLDPAMHGRTCGYWYTLESHATAHTAFRTAHELIDWLGVRGLKLAEALPEKRGTFKFIRVEGCYKRASYMDKEAFDAIIPLIEIAEMDNGDYTLAKVTQDEQGIRTVHMLNPNVKERVVFPPDYEMEREN